MIRFFILLLFTDILKYFNLNLMILEFIIRLIRGNSSKKVEKQIQENQRLYHIIIIPEIYHDVNSYIGFRMNTHTHI